MPNRAVEVVRDDAPGFDDQVAVSACDNVLERQMDGHRHDREFGRPQHHDRAHALAGRLSASVARIRYGRDRRSPTR